MKIPRDDTQAAPPGGIHRAFGAIAVLLVLLGTAAPALAQDVRPFQIEDIRGIVEVGFLTNLEERTRSRSSGSNFDRVELSQLLHLSADGYIYHPEFLTFDTGVKLEAIEGLAGQSDDRLLWGGDFRFNFLEKRQNSLSIHGTRSDAESAQPFSETYTVTNELYGATFFQKWGWIPFDLSYLHGSRSGGLSDQLDDSWDKVLFDGSYQIGERSEGKLGYGLIFEKIQGVDRRRQNLSASNTSYLGEGSNKRLNTYLSLFEERNGRVLRNAAGSTEFNWEHAEDLRTRYVLRGFWSDTEAQNTTTLNPSFFLDHQLYDSLETRLEIFGRLEDSSFRKRQEFGGSISENYLKQLGGWGQLNISVAPHVSVTRSRPNGNTAFVFDEEHLMVEEDEVLLRQPDIIESTIVVTDTSGSIVYDRDEGDGLGGDYTVTQSGDGIETELARTINSTIADPQLVLVDYQYELAEDNDTLFTGVNVHTALYFFGDWSVFGRYDNIDHYVLSGDKEDIRFNDFNKYVFGLRFNGLWLTAKAKFEEKDATTGSYRSYSGGATFSTYGTVTWNAHLRANYAYLDRIDSGETVNRFSVSGSANKRFFKRGALEAEGGWRRVRWSGKSSQANDIDALHINLKYSWWYGRIEVRLETGFAQLLRPVEDRTVYNFELRVRRVF